MYRAFFTTFAFTFGTKDMFLQSKFTGLAVVEIFKTHFKSMNHIFTTARALRTSTSSATKTATKELGKEIFSIHTTHTTRSTVETLLTILVIHLTSFGIRQNFISMRYFLEFITGFRILFYRLDSKSAIFKYSNLLYLIRMIFQGQLSVTFLEFTLGSIRTNTQDVVKLCFSNHIFNTVNIN